MVDWMFTELNKEPGVRLWRQAVLTVIGKYPCAETLNLSAETFDYACKLGVSVSMNILTQTIGQYQWPSNWIEAIKDRFLPLRLREIWPVKYRIIDVSAIYPKAKLPDPVFKATEYYEPKEG